MACRTTCVVDTFVDSVFTPGGSMSRQESEQNENCLRAEVGDSVGTSGCQNDAEDCNKGRKDSVVDQKEQCDRWDIACDEKKDCELKAMDTSCIVEMPDVEENICAICLDEFTEDDPAKETECG